MLPKAPMATTAGNKKRLALV